MSQTPPRFFPSVDKSFKMIVYFTPISWQTPCFHSQYGNTHSRKTPRLVCRRRQRILPIFAVILPIFGILDLLERVIPPPFLSLVVIRVGWGSKVSKKAKNNISGLFEFWPTWFKSRSDSEILNSQVICPHVSDTSTSNLMLIHQA